MQSRTLFFFSQAKLSVLYSKWQNFLYCTTANNDKIFKIIVIVDKIPSQIISFLIIWMPYAVTSLMETAGKRNTLLFTLYTVIHYIQASHQNPPFHWPSLPFLPWLSRWLLSCHGCYDFWFIFFKSAVCIDPIIYFGLNPQFRSEMVKSLRKLGSLISMPKR